MNYYHDTATVTIEAIVDTALVQTGDILSVKTIGGSYQWINCADNTIIQGDTSASLTVTKTGSYAAIIKVGNCVDTTGCYTVVPAYVKEVASHTTIHVYPNPANDVLYIAFDKKVPEAGIVIKDLYGRSIITAGKQVMGNQARIDINTLASGLYILEVKFNGVSAQYKFLKN